MQGDGVEDVGQLFAGGHEQIILVLVIIRQVLISGQKIELIRTLDKLTLRRPKVVHVLIWVLLHESFAKDVSHDGDVAGTIDQFEILKLALIPILIFKRKLNRRNLNSFFRLLHL